MDSALQNTSSCCTVLIDASLIDESERNQEIFHTDEVKDQLLSDYMKEVGVHEPITCFQKSDGRYEIISGHRRYKARVLKGDQKIDVIVTQPPVSDGDKIYQLIFDNIHSRQLKTMDLARALKAMKDTWLPEQRQKGMVGDTKCILADKFNISSTKVSRYLRLLQLTPELQDKVQDGILSVDAALSLTADDVCSLDGLQEFINESLDDAKDTFDELSPISKNTIEKMIREFRSKTASDREPIILNKDNESIHRERNLTRKKLEKNVESFRTIINSNLSPNFKPTNTDVEALEQLQVELLALIEKCKSKM